jgi:hypothetical protein
VWGTLDQGASFSFPSPSVPSDINHFFSSLSSHFNLKKHDVVLRVNSDTLRVLSTSGPADLQLHRGNDGKLYVHNVTRLLPCAPPNTKNPTEHLFNMV